MKRFFALAFASALMFSLAACGNDGGGAGGKQSGGSLSLAAMKKAAHATKTSAFYYVAAKSPVPAKRIPGSCAVFHFRLINENE